MCGEKEKERAGQCVCAQKRARGKENAAPLSPFLFPFSPGCCRPRCRTPRCWRPRSCRPGRPAAHHSLRNTHCEPEPTCLALSSLVLFPPVPPTRAHTTGELNRPTQGRENSHTAPPRKKKKAGSRPECTLPFAGFRSISRRRRPRLARTPTRTQPLSPVYSSPCTHLVRASP